MTDVIDAFQVNSFTCHSPCAACICPVICNTYLQRA